MSQTSSDTMIQCSGLIYDIRHGTQQDGPGARTTILFKGCSFSCWWCPNPELQSAAVELMVNEGRCVHCGACIDVCFMEAARETDGSENTTQRVTIEREECIVCGACISECKGESRALLGKRMTTAEVMAQIEAGLPAEAGPAHGVTFSGGEPLMQSRFLEELLKACKTRGIATVVDTSGYVPWKVFERVRSWVDLFQFDLKFYENDKHWEFTGLFNTQILENIQALSVAGQPLILRVPIIPSINDDFENMSAIAKFSAQLPHLDGVELIPHQQIPRYRYERLGKPYRGVSDLDPGSDLPEKLVQLFQNQGLNAWISPVTVAG